jgi:2,3-bisphosphoglycerate-dependent phosphoglycerate mutase
MARSLRIPARIAILAAAILAAATLGGLSVPALAPQTAAPQDIPSLVVLVRHAEKAEAPPSDPPLSPDGTTRAAALARVLSDAGITRIHSSDTRRTRDTAAPLAAALGIEIELYDPRDLPAMASRLRSLPGRHLVVGHSNTTDELSGLMGGATFGQIEEPWEYDRLYFLTPRPHLPGTAPGSAGFETVLVRFGAAVSPGS